MSSATATCTLFCSSGRGNSCSARESLRSKVFRWVYSRAAAREALHCSLTKVSTAVRISGLAAARLPSVCLTNWSA